MNARIRLSAALAIASALSLVGCGKEIGRIPFHEEGTGAASLQLDAGKKLAIWTSLDVKYSGAFGAVYDVELVQDGNVVSKGSCDAINGINVSTNKREVHLGNSHTVKYNGKMACEIAAPKAGQATLRAKLRFVPKPADLTVNDVSLVVKE
jgi:hypothetical protein